MALYVDEYLEWMRARGYADSTRAQSGIDARRLLNSCATGIVPPQWMKHEAKRLVAWAKEHDYDLSEYQPALGQLAQIGPRFHGRLAGANRRKYPKAPLPEAEWQRLGQLIREAQSPEARVLWFTMLTGLRIGDTLRIERSALRNALSDGRLELRVKGGKPVIKELRGPALEAAAVIIDTWGRDGSVVHEYVYPKASEAARPYKAAYQRCHRELARLGREAGIVSRTHSHRLRHTFGVQIWHASDHDIEAVRRELVHTDARTSLGYIREEQPSQHADLSEHIGRRLVRDP